MLLQPEPPGAVLGLRAVMRPSSKRLRLAAFVVALGATRFTIADDRALNLDVGDPSRRGREVALVIEIGRASCRERVLTDV